MTRNKGTKIEGTASEAPLAVLQKDSAHPQRTD